MASMTRAQRANPLTAIHAGRRAASFQQAGLTDTSSYWNPQPGQDLPGYAESGGYIDGKWYTPRDYASKISTTGAAGAAGAGTSGSGGGATGVGSVDSSFERALAALSGTSGDVEKLYQQGKRRTMSSLAMQAVNTGMANTLNMPAAELAYEGQVRPAMNVALAQTKAGVLQNLGQTAAGIYGVDVGAQASRYSSDVGAAASRYASDAGVSSAASGQQLQFASNQANQALQRYIADLRYSSTTQAGSTSPVATTVYGSPRV